MSREFYERFLSTVFWLIFILILGVLTCLIGFAYLVTQNRILYGSFIGALVLIYAFSLAEYHRFKDLHEDLGQGLLIPEVHQQSEHEEKLEPLNIDLEDKTLRICLLYRNGSSFEEIKRDLGLNHPTQVKRELVKGIGFLLRFYHEHKEDDVKE